MFAEQDVKVDSYHLEDGGVVYRMTHIPTGLSIQDELDLERPVLERLKSLSQRLERIVQIDAAAGRAG
jgi:hypothetical protein